MGIKKMGEIPDRLQRVRGRFERWRRTRKVRTRTPESLWKAAVKMAGVYGVHRTAKTLRVNYYALKKRTELEVDAAKIADASGAAATFFELAPLERAPLELNRSDFHGDLHAGLCECMVELERGGGVKMRVCIKGAGVPDLATLCRNFWRGET